MVHTSRLANIPGGMCQSCAAFDKLELPCHEAPEVGGEALGPVVGAELGLGGVEDLGKEGGLEGGEVVLLYSWVNSTYL